MQRILIVGQGLMGSWMAYRLLDQGHAVTVVDPGLPSASSISAGLINPVTGKRLVSSAALLAHIREAKEAYKKIEERLGIYLLTERPLIRACKDAFDANRLRIRLEDPFYTGLLEVVPTFDFHLNAPYGMVNIKGAATVDVPLFLQTMRAWIASQGDLRAEFFDEKELGVSEGVPYWRDEAYDAVIFCTGHEAQRSAFFNDLPIAADIGMILTVRTGLAKMLFGRILIVKGYWILPVNETYCRVGATYRLDEATSQEILLETLRSVFADEPLPMDVTLSAGIRASTENKEPFIARSRVCGKIFCIAGLSSRGSVWAPFISKQFTTAERGLI